MQFSENWLRSLVAVDLDRQGLDDALTMSGLEVEEVNPIAPAFDKVVVAEIVSAEKHPDADRLQLCEVNVGEEAPLQIVCGAPNARVGIRIPCAMVGAKLPEFKIKKAKVRGVESFGMLCSAKELGIAEAADGIMELSSDAPVGQSIRQYLDLDDAAFVIKLTPNRSDCLSLHGIAREVKAITGAAMTTAEITPVLVQISDTKSVQVHASEQCPRYTARVITGVTADVTTPDWMVRHLERSGLRSISAVVDITNYVLLLLGQPMHAFDAEKLSGDMQVRFANAGETLLMLNEQEAILKADDLVIADDNGPVALAGIMGGLPTSVTDATTTICLESAFFTPAVMAGKARRLGLSTDSSYRFERGVDFANTAVAMELATQLIIEVCGGQAGEVVEHIGILPTRSPVSLRVARLNSVLGITFDQSQVATFFDQLQFEYTLDDGVFTVTPPSYRFDIDREVDLIEEVARLHGYDHVPAIKPETSLSILPVDETKQTLSQIKSELVQLGYQEVINYSFVEESWETGLLGNDSPIRLQNPIASQYSVMRTSLWGGLLDTLSYNLNRQQDRAMLFECGSIYQVREDGFVETPKVSGLLYGTVQLEQWSAESRKYDFYDLKAHVERLLGENLEYQKAAHSALHPGQSAQILREGQVVGWLGQLHPKWQQSFGIAQSTFIFEVDYAAIQAVKQPAYQEVSKFLPIRRDIAVVVEESLALQDLTQTVSKAELPLVQVVQLFDVYQGEGVPAGKKSLALSVMMHDAEKTLIDEEADRAIANLLELLQNEFSAELRT